MLEAKHLSFSYGTRPILKEISLSVSEHESVFLIGRNGAGKTTLFKCMLGLLKGYSGEIWVNRANAAHMSAARLAKEIAYIPQSHYPAFNYSVLDMVLMGMASSFSCLSQPKQTHINKALDALKKAGVDRLKDCMYMQLSGGERQLVLIARALAQDADILFMDEPTSSLDYGNQIRVMQFIRELAEKGYTIVISCHNPQQALMFGSRVVALDDGKIAADGPPADVITQELIEQLYHVDVSFEQTSAGKIILPRC